MSRKFFPAGAAFLVLLTSWLLTGCASWPLHHHAEPRIARSLAREIKSQPNRIFLLTSPALVPGKPMVLLLHGATDKPGEMFDIAGLWAHTHNVLLYSYNFHESLQKVAGDLLSELIRLDKQRYAAGATNGGMTVITYSYSATVFRKAVLLAPDESLFCDVSLIQLVPTAGGSFLARKMENPLTGSLVSAASKASAAENPFGKTAEELWGDSGTRIFHQRIDPRRMFTVLVPNDPHSLANIDNPAVRKRYENGIGRNVVRIPERFGVTHDNAPNHPAALEYLVMLQSNLTDVRRVQTSKTSARSSPRAPAVAD
jgi:hypothetical protein